VLKEGYDEKYALRIKEVLKKGYDEK